jgi:hypothetical protein
MPPGGDHHGARVTAILRGREEWYGEKNGYGDFHALPSFASTMSKN